MRIHRPAITGSISATNLEVSGTIKVAGVEVPHGTAVSSSFVQGAAVSGSFVQGAAVSSSFAQKSAVSSSISEPTANVSGSSTSTGSFGRVEVNGIGPIGGWVKLQSTTVDDDATVDITTGIGSTYDHYMIMVKSVVGVTDGTDLQIKLTVGGALKGADYRYRVLTHSSAGSGFNDNVSDSAATIRYAMAGLGSNASEGGDGVFWFNDPTNTSKFHMIHWNAVYSNPAIHTVSGAGGYTGGTGALTNVQFLMNSGNLESGTFTLYGLSKG